jgi:putative DNA methylase
MTITRKKLIEVALPLEAINIACAKEKQPGIGAHPRGLHLWWARRPLAAARAVIFAQMVDDPSTYVDTLKQDPKLNRQATGILKRKVKVWEEAIALQKKLAGTGVDAPEPGPKPTIDEVIADQERQRLFRIIEDLVLWENTTNEKVLQAARDEIWASWRRTCLDNVDHPRAKELFDRRALPAFHDPFAGGGALPLEAQRLGLESYASDLNPVAVLINKAMIEIPPKFAGRPPVNPAARKKRDLIAREWKGVQGLAEDVRYYGQWMRDEAEKRIGSLYPDVEVTKEMVKERPDLKPQLGSKLKVIAWLWARTVKSPNPAFANVEVPLASTFMLSTRKGKEAYIEPLIDNNGYQFKVKVGHPRDLSRTKAGLKRSRANFDCLMSGVPITGDYIKSEGQAGRMGVRLMAIIAKGKRGRIYLSPTHEQEAIAGSKEPEWRPELTISGSTQYLGIKPYGIDRVDQLFVDRQLVSLMTFCDLIKEVVNKVQTDASKGGFDQTGLALDAGGLGALAYAEAVGTYLAFAVDRLADYNSTIATWKPSGEQVMHTYTRQAIQMTWDFAESNALGDSAICWHNAVKYAAENLEASGGVVSSSGRAVQADAAAQAISIGKVVSTDPPYYDNVPYADLSDFFYVWMRRSLKGIFPNLFATVAVPKAEELVAFAYRHKGGKQGAETFFLDGMTEAMHRIAEQAHPGFPVTIYYAFKQSESDTDAGTASTGWETFLDAVVRAGFATSGTWPMRTELGNRMRGMDSNALASSIVLVCRKRPATAPTATRREFVAALKAELPAALADLQRGNIAPVDLAQAAIGPGMAVYTRYAQVLDAQGKALSVREALALINETLDEALASQEGDFDADSRWALTWFDQHGFDEGPAGEAILLATAKATALNGLEQAGIIESGRGKVRLYRPDELPADWDPATDSRLTSWEMVHHLVGALEGSETMAAELLLRLGSKAAVARELAYRLYNICERRKRNQEALWYNSLVQSWPELERMALEMGKARPQGKQAEMFNDDNE